MQLMYIKIGLLSVLLLKTCVRKKGGLGGFAPQTLTRSYYFEPPLSKKRSRATADNFDGTKQLMYSLEPTAQAKYFYLFNCMSTGSEKVVSILDIHLPELELELEKA